MEPLAGQHRKISYKKLWTSEGDDDYLGKGGFSQVFRCYNETFGTVAIKSLISTDPSNTSQIQAILHEIDIHEKAKFKHIISIFGVTQKLDFVGIVLEYMPFGNLNSLLTNNLVKVNWVFKLRAMCETSSAVNFLHNLNEDSRITHNDIKPENILLDEELHVKLSDFGGSNLSKVTSSAASRARSNKDEKTVLTVLYTAPELLRDLNLQRTCAMDVYSFAIVVYCTIFQQHPFPGKQEALIERAIKNGQRPKGDESKLDFLSENDKNIHELLNFIMVSCWNENPQKRPKMKEVYSKLDNKFKSFEELFVNDEIHKLRTQLKRKEESDPTTRINILKKIRMWNNVNGSPAIQKPQPERTVPQKYRPDSIAQNLPKESPQNCVQEPDFLNLYDPYIRVGNMVQICANFGDMCNNNRRESLPPNIQHLADRFGIVSDIKNNQFVIKIEGRNIILNKEHTQKRFQDNDFYVGQVVRLAPEKNIAEKFQRWNDELKQHIDEPGVVYRFIPDSPDLLVVYKNGDILLCNSNILQRVEEQNLSINQNFKENPQVKVGDYVYHNLDDEILEALQKSYGGWNDEMAGLQKRIGKLIFIDNRERAYVAYSSKTCFVFNPAIFKRVGKQEAIEMQKIYKEEMKKSSTERSNYLNNPLQIGDKVKVCLPLDIVIELQRECGGWCFQMLEVYGKDIFGVIQQFDSKGNAQILFDTGNRWTLNSAALSLAIHGNKDAGYKPPFQIGDKVKVILSQFENVPENQVIHAMRMLDLSPDQVDVFTKPGQVLGIDEEMDIIVQFSSGKRYGFKKDQLLKCEEQ